LSRAGAHDLVDREGKAEGAAQLGDFFAVGQRCDDGGFCHRDCRWPGDYGLGGARRAGDGGQRRQGSRQQQDCHQGRHQAHGGSQGAGVIPSQFRCHCRAAALA